MKITHKLEIPKREYQGFLEGVIVPKLIELNISDYPIGVYAAKKGDHKTVSAYYIIDSKTNMPIAQLSIDGKLTFNLPEKFHFLGYVDYWTNILANYQKGKDH